MSGVIPLRCVVCRQGCIQIIDEDEMHCDSCNASFGRSRGRPIMLRPDNRLFSIDTYRDIGATQPSSRGLAALIPSASVNMAVGHAPARLRDMLPVNRRATVLVVGGGTQRAVLDPLLTKNRAVDVIYTDIDVNADVDLFADAHDLPFFDSSVDAVITTAVLEHVMYPERVAAEISRVVRIGGFVYSELPFMQQVHEGAYDFTRYTASGHQRLFHLFDPVEFGLVAGPATSLVWALEHFFLAFASGQRSRFAVKAATRCLFGWIRYVDYLLRHRPAALDGASCTYLIGRRIAEARSDESIVAAYAGAQTLSHG